MLISHPDRTLQEHLLGLKKVIDAVISEKEQHLFHEEKFKRLLLLLIIYHDIAKGTDYFQHKIIEVTVKLKEKTELFLANKEWLNNFLLEKIEIGQAIRKEPSLTRHGELGAYLIQSEWLEEALNLEQLILLQIIKKHHGNLQNFVIGKFCFDDSPEKILQKELLLRRFEKLAIDSFIQTILPLGKIDKEKMAIQKILSRFERQRFVKRILSKLKKEQTVVPFLKTLFLYSLLLSADKGDVKLGKKEKVFKRTLIPSNVIDLFKKEKIEGGKSIDKDREDAYQTILNNLKNNVDSFFFSITLPTGMGKTFSGYKAALWLKENHYPNHRIVYCLPFTSIIDQNAALFQAILKNYNREEIHEKLITIHHYLTEVQEEDIEGNEIDQQEWEYVTEGWQNEIIITTFVQLLESIFTNRNRSLRKFHNLVNSIIILDEVQNIDPILYEATI